MGATNIDMTLPGHLTREQVLQKFKAQQESDRIEYGTDAYNGSFSTIESLRFGADLRNVEGFKNPFASVSEATDFCLQHAQKWEFAVAVQSYTGQKTRQAKPTFGGIPAGTVGLITFDGKVCDQLNKADATRLLTLWSKFKMLAAEQDAAQNIINNAVHQMQRFNDFELTGQTLKDLRTALKTRAKLAPKVAAARQAYAEREDTLQNRYFPVTDEHGALVWVIAGWAAC